MVSISFLIFEKFHGTNLTTTPPSLLYLPFFAFLYSSLYLLLKRYIQSLFSLLSSLLHLYLV